MATYLVVENNKYTKSYKLKTTFGSNPYIKVSNSYLDLQEYQTTDTAGIKARVNVKDYVPKEASETITTTASRKSTYTVSYVSGRSSSTSGYEGYSSVVDMWKGYSTGTIISGVSSKQSGYYTSSVDKTTLSNITTLTRQSNYSFTDVTSAGMSSTEALTRASNYTMTAVNSAGLSSVTTLYSNVLIAYDGVSSSYGAASKWNGRSWYYGAASRWDGEVTEYGEATKWSGESTYREATKWKARSSEQVATKWSGQSLSNVTLEWNITYTMLGDVTKWNGVSTTSSQYWDGISTRESVYGYSGKMDNKTITSGIGVTSIDDKDTKSLTTIGPWSGPATYNGKSYSSSGEKVLKYVVGTGTTHFTTQVVTNTYSGQTYTVVRSNVGEYFSNITTQAKNTLYTTNTSLLNSTLISVGDNVFTNTGNPNQNSAVNTTWVNSSIRVMAWYNWDTSVLQWYYRDIFKITNGTISNYTGTNTTVSVTKRIFADSTTVRRSYSYSSFYTNYREVASNAASNTNWLNSEYLTKTASQYVTTDKPNPDMYDVTNLTRMSNVGAVYGQSTSEHLTATSSGSRKSDIGIVYNQTNSENLTNTTSVERYIRSILGTTNNTTNRDDIISTQTRKTVNRYENVYDAFESQTSTLINPVATAWRTDVNTVYNLYNNTATKYYSYTEDGWITYTQYIAETNNSAGLDVAVPIGWKTNTISTRRNTTNSAGLANTTAVAWNTVYYTASNRTNSEGLTNTTAVDWKTDYYTVYNTTNSVGLTGTTGKYSQQATGYSGYSSRASTSGYKGYSSRESISGYSGYATRVSQYYTSSAAVGNMSSTSNKTTTNYQSVVESPSAAGLVETSIAHTSKWYRTSNVYNNGLSSTSYLTNTYYITSYTTNGGISSTTEKTYESTRSSTYETTI